MHVLGRGSGGKRESKSKRESSEGSMLSTEPESERGARSHDLGMNT